VVDSIIVLQPFQRVGIHRVYLYLRKYESTAGKD